jgi:hypothetical protein
VKYTEESLSKQKYGKISFICFIITIPGKPKKGLFLCDCNKLTTKQISSVLIGSTKSCGHCSIISKEIMAVTKFGHLRQTTPKDTMPGSHEKDEFTCDCGRNKHIVIKDVLSNKAKTCGQCGTIPAAVIAVTKFGHLRQTIPKDTMPGSARIDNFTCDCGGSRDLMIVSALSGNSKTCGNCGLIVKQWYQENRMKLKELQCPIAPGCILNGPIEALETIEKMNRSFPAICPACKNKYKPTLNAIKQGRRLTCMCVSSKISSPAVQISEFVRSFGFETKFEYKVNKLAYDIFVQSKSLTDKSLLIEYDGFRFHNGSSKSVLRDVMKEKNALDSGYKFLRIKELDWKKENRDNMKKQLEALLIHGR